MTNDPKALPYLTVKKKISECARTYRFLAQSIIGLVIELKIPWLTSQRLALWPSLPEAQTEKSKLGSRKHINVMLHSDLLLGKSDKASPSSDNTCW